MLHSILGLVGAALVWLTWEILGELIGEAVWATTAALLRPIHRSFVNASRPWPLVVSLAIGVAMAVAGFVQLRSRELTGWHVVADLLALLGGIGIALVAPLLWRDARRQRAREASPPDA